MTDLTPERLAEIRETAAKATPGPWAYEPHIDHKGDLTRESICSGYSRRDLVEIVEDVHNHYDAIHIANCDPQTILGMADEIERLRKERDQYKQWNEDNQDASVLSGICLDKAVKDRDAARAELASVLDRESATTARYDALVASLDDVLLGITEYWNGSNTEGAMSDALHEIIRRAETARNSLKGARDDQG